VIPQIREQYQAESEKFRQTERELEILRAQYEAERERLRNSEAELKTLRAH
jgi:phage-related tail protein